MTATALSVRPNDLVHIRPGQQLWMGWLPLPRVGVVLSTQVAASVLTYRPRFRPSWLWWLYVQLIRLTAYWRAR